MKDIELKQKQKTNKAFFKPNKVCVFFHYFVIISVKPKSHWFSRLRRTQNA